MNDRLTKKGGYPSIEAWSEMFPRKGGYELDSGFLRSGRGFRSDKRKKLYSDEEIAAQNKKKKAMSLHHTWMKAYVMRKRSTS